MSRQDPVITKLRVARLFNLGDYEHERIEVTVEARGYEIEDGSIQRCELLNPAETLQELRAAIEACRPIEMSWEAKQGLSIENGQISLVPDEECKGFGETSISCGREYVSELAKYRAKVGIQKAAIEQLNKFGAVVAERKGGAV